MKRGRNEMNISDLFLKEFNIIESHLKEKLEVDNHIPFSQMVYELSDKSYLIRKNKSILRHLSDLRNTIVHKKGLDYLALPTETALDSIISLRLQLTEPTKLYSIIKNEVTVKRPDTLLVDVLSEIKIKGYSQFPVYENNQYLGLISNNAISRWISSNIEEDFTIIKDISKTTVSHVLDFNEEFDRVVFISKDINVDTFIQEQLVESRVENVWLITHSGKKTEKPLSIVTIYDIEKILRYYN
jgi:predicted transcriptional regulator